LATPPDPGAIVKTISYDTEGQNSSRENKWQMQFLRHLRGWKKK
jgi:hypothetical protein